MSQNAFIIKKKSVTGKSLSVSKVHAFQKIILDFYRNNKRDMPWREKHDPYTVFVSEIMLQQTQVPRVLLKFHDFIAHFPDFAALARAETHELLTVWQGMGYNRRVLNMRKTAQIIEENFQGTMPESLQELVALPGIGKYTAAAIRTFAWNQPEVLIETNIRAVFIHHFFNNCDSIDDSEIAPLVKQTLDVAAPRDWYYALMDYGTYLKENFGNPAKKSRHYAKQSAFKGSDREMRGLILKKLLQSPCTEKQISAECEDDATRIKLILTQLYKEGFIQKDSNKWIIK